MDVYRIVGDDVVRGVRSGSYIAKGEFISLVDALTELRHQLMASGKSTSRVESDLRLALARREESA